MFKMLLLEKFNIWQILHSNFQPFHTGLRIRARSTLALSSGKQFSGMSRLVFQWILNQILRKAFQRFVQFDYKIWKFLLSLHFLCFLQAYNTIRTNFNSHRKTGNIYRSGKSTICLCTQKQPSKILKNKEIRKLFSCPIYNFSCFWYLFPGWKLQNFQNCLSFKLWMSCLFLQSMRAWMMKYVQSNNNDGRILCCFLTHHIIPQIKETDVLQWCVRSESCSSILNNLWLTITIWITVGGATIWIRTYKRERERERFKIINPKRSSF